MPFIDLTFVGQNYGFNEFVNSVPDASGDETTGGGGVIRVPNSNVPTIGNTPSLFITGISEETGPYSDAFNSGETGTLANDEAFSFVPPFPAGVMIITNGAGQSARAATVAFSTATNSIQEAGFLGSVMNLGAGVLAGTTGTAGRINLSAENGRVYVENRSGTPQNMRWAYFR